MPPLQWLGNLSESQNESARGIGAGIGGVLGGYVDQKNTNRELDIEEKRVELETELLKNKIDFVPFDRKMEMMQLIQRTLSSLPEEMREDALSRLSTDPEMQAVADSINYPLDWLRPPPPEPSFMEKIKDPVMDAGRWVGEQVGGLWERMQRGEARPRVDVDVNSAVGSSSPPFGGSGGRTQVMTDANGNRALVEVDSSGRPVRVLREL